MKQIISSYEHHFKVDLMVSETNNDSVSDLIERLLFDCVKEKVKLNNTSLMDKINKLKSKEKEREK